MICPYDGLRYEDDTQLSSGELQKALEYHLISLESLTAFDANSNSGTQSTIHMTSGRADLISNAGSDLSQSIMQHQFPMLRYLEVRIDFLAEYSPFHENGFFWDPTTMPTNHIAQSLPPSLEELRLDATDTLRFYQFPEDEYDCIVKDILAWLLEVAAAKLAAFPALKMVGYNPSFFCGDDEGRYDAPMREVKDLYAGVDVKLYGYDDD